MIISNVPGTLPRHMFVSTATLKKTWRPWMSPSQLYIPRAEAKWLFKRKWITLDLGKKGVSKGNMVQGIPGLQSS